MNLAGLILAFLGAVALWRAQVQVNPLVGLWSVNFFRFEGQEGRNEEFRRILVGARRLTFVGWALLSVGFLLQVLAAPIA